MHSRNRTVSTVRWARVLVRRKSSLLYVVCDFSQASEFFSNALNCFLGGFWVSENCNHCWNERLPFRCYIYCIHGYNDEVSLGFCQRKNAVDLNS